MTLREFFLENFAGDLEYHSGRALLYLSLATAGPMLLDLLAFREEIYRHSFSLRTWQPYSFTQRHILSAEVV